MRTRLRVSPAFVISMIALFVALGGTAVAATGGNFILGKANTAANKSTLTATNVGPALQITNTGTAATALNLNVAATRPPFTTNSQTKVVNLNADKLDGIDSTGFLTTSGKAADADMLDGLDSSAFLPAGGTAANSELLGGLSSAQYMHGGGQILKAAAALAPNNSGYWPVLNTDTPALRIGYACPSPLSQNGALVLINFSGEVVNVFIDNGGTNPLYQQLAAGGGRWDVAASAGGEHYTVQIQGSQVTTFEIFSVHRATDCHIELQGAISN